jgi:UDP-2-acetamido-3-amino-2,3-dideoxy-glucuronate N-acetyltransferase
MVVFDDSAPWERKLLLYPHVVEMAGDAPKAIRAEPRPIAVEEHEPLKLECQHFIDCIAQGQEPRTDGAEGLRVMRVLARASATMNSARSRRAGPERAGSVHRRLNL